jgi:glycerol-3-phosphate dehydrogenase
MHAELPAAVDVAVIGGGITGAGVALDAASRGYRVALLEAHDWASGTSSRSSKLVHGGLRYLQQKEVTLVRENLAERQRLLDNAPHLVSLLPFVIPVFHRGGMAAAATEKAVIGGLATALRLYDASGGSRIGRTFERLGAEETATRLRGVTDAPTAGGFIYYDCQADDARLVLTIVQTARAHGAVAANHTPVRALTFDSDGSVSGVALADGRTVSARCVVNAAGVWGEQFLPHDATGEPTARITPAKGVHLTFRADDLRVDDAIVLPVRHDKRSLFVVPGRAIGCPSVVYVGTTDTPHVGPLDDPVCDAGDVAYVLGALNDWRPSGSRQLVASDVIATWAGLRPLLAGARSERTADLSRRHSVITGHRGLVSILGGKLTTYRAMAEDTVDEVVRGFGDRRPCRTANLRLQGADGADRARAEVAAELGESIASHLVSRYGAGATGVAALVRTDPALAAPLVDGLPHLAAEAVHAVLHEDARHLDDVLSRRLRCLLADRAATVAAAPRTAALVAPHAGWDVARERDELAAFEAISARESAAMAGAA